jgi:hypothetical protein
MSDDLDDLPTCAGASIPAPTLTPATHGDGSRSLSVVVVWPAGVEAVLRLRRLAGDQFDISLVSASDTLVYRPLSVLRRLAPHWFCATRWLGSCPARGQ